MVRESLVEFLKNALVKTFKIDEMYDILIVKDNEYLSLNSNEKSTRLFYLIGGEEGSLVVDLNKTRHNVLEVSIKALNTVLIISKHDKTCNIKIRSLISA